MKQRFRLLADLEILNEFDRDSAGNFIPSLYVGLTALALKNARGIWAYRFESGRVA